MFVASASPAPPLPMATGTTTTTIPLLLPLLQLLPLQPPPLVHCRLSGFWLQYCFWSIPQPATPLRSASYTGHSAATSSDRAACPKGLWVYGFTRAEVFGRERGTPNNVKSRGPYVPGNNLIFDRMGVGFGNSEPEGPSFYIFLWLVTMQISEAERQRERERETQK